MLIGSDVPLATYSSSLAAIGAPILVAFNKTNAFLCEKRRRPLAGGRKSITLMTPIIIIIIRPTVTTTTTTTESSWASQTDANCNIHMPSLPPNGCPNWAKPVGWAGLCTRRPAQDDDDVDDHHHHLQQTATCAGRMTCPQSDTPAERPHGRLDDARRVAR